MKKILIAIVMAVCLISSFSSYAGFFSSRTDDTLTDGKKGTVGLGNTWDKD